MEKEKIVQATREIISTNIGGKTGIYQPLCGHCGKPLGGKISGSLNNITSQRITCRHCKTVNRLKW